MKKSLTVFLALSLLCSSVNAVPPALRVLFGSGAAGLVVFPYWYVNMRSEARQGSLLQLPSDEVKAPAPVATVVGPADKTVLEEVKGVLQRYGLEKKVKVVDQPLLANPVLGIGFWQQLLCMDFARHKILDEEVRGFDLVRGIWKLKQHEAELVTLAAPAAYAFVKTLRPKLPSNVKYKKVGEEWVKTRKLINFRFLGRMLLRTPSAMIGCLVFSVPIRWALDLSADREAAKAIGTEGCIKQIEGVRARNLSQPGWDVLPLTGDFIPGLLFAPPLGLRLWQMRRIAKSVAEQAKQQAEQGDAGGVGDK